MTADEILEEVGQITGSRYLESASQASRNQIISEAERVIFSNLLLQINSKSVQLTDTVDIPGRQQVGFELPADFDYVRSVYYDGVFLEYADEARTDLAEDFPADINNIYYSFHSDGLQRYLLTVPALRSPIDLQYWSREPSIVRTRLEHGGWTGELENNYSNLYPDLYIYYAAHLVAERERDDVRSERYLLKFNEKIGNADQHERWSKGDS